MTGSTGRRPADVYYDGILPGVERPSRYIDRELNLSGTGYIEGAFNTLLVFPDVYEIGMSHQGLRLLYHHLARAGFPVEFAFSPWPDMEKRLRASGDTLRSWQTGTPVGRFDLVGITMPYELHYTNILAFLDVSGIPLEASARSASDPLVVAGGPCSSNPLPILRGLDAVFLGDGEESLREAVELLSGMKAEKGGAGTAAGRDGMKKALAGIRGVHVEGI
ncbi:MAG TPA: hypothetical protein VLA34_13860, partial [Candidatus Krumholzibacterium sp.]|nr:hypothetical protein [Candidatus Krumholzibacterium sp.]